MVLLVLSDIVGEIFLVADMCVSDANENPYIIKLTYIVIYLPNSRKFIENY